MHIYNTYFYIRASRQAGGKQAAKEVQNRFEDDDDFSVEHAAGCLKRNTAAAGQEAGKHMISEEVETSRDKISARGRDAEEGEGSVSELVEHADNGDTKDDIEDEDLSDLQQNL